MEQSTDPGRWDFGLTEEQEARAARLHQECLVADLMNQHPGGANIFKTGKYLVFIFLHCQSK